MSCYYTDTLSHCFIKYTPTAWWCSSLQHFTSVASFLHLLLISSSCLTKLSMCDRKDQAFSKLPQSESWWPFKCCRVAFEVKKRKKSWGEGVKKNCPPSLSLLFPLSLCLCELAVLGWDTKAPEEKGLRIAANATQIFSLSQPLNPMPSLPRCVCMWVCMRPPPLLNKWFCLPTLNHKVICPPNEGKSHWYGNYIICK